MSLTDYKVEVYRVIDGDTVEVDIDLGFGVWLRRERVRLSGIDAPETRTRDSVEALFGEAAKLRLIDLLVMRNGQDVRDGKKVGPLLRPALGSTRDKFGRILADFILFVDKKQVSVVATLIAEGFAVAYDGRVSRESIRQKHLWNREKLLSRGIVSRSDFEAALSRARGVVDGNIAVVARVEGGEETAAAPMITFPSVPDMRHTESREKVRLLYDV